MIRPGAVLALLAVVAAALAVTAVWLPFDNPDIHGTSRGQDYTCLAPYDTVLNHADNFPGGELPPDGDDIAARCRQAGQERFGTSLATGSGAAALAVLTGALLWRRRRTPVRASV